MWLFLSIHVMKVTFTSPFGHLKCINWCLIVIALRMSSVTLLYKLQNATENFKVVQWNPVNRILSVQQKIITLTGLFQ